MPQTDHTPRGPLGNLRSDCTGGWRIRHPHPSENRPAPVVEHREDQWARFLLTVLAIPVTVAGLGLFAGLGPWWAPPAALAGAGLLLASLIGPITVGLLGDPREAGWVDIDTTPRLIGLGPARVPIPRHPAVTTAAEAAMDAGTVGLDGWVHPHAEDARALDEAKREALLAPRRDRGSARRDG